MRELTIYAKGLTLGFSEDQIVSCMDVNDVDDGIGTRNLDLIQRMMLDNTVILVVTVEGQETDMATGQLAPNGKKYSVTYCFRPEDVQWTSITEELDE